MKVDTIPQMVRDSKRLHQIVPTLSKYGLAPWLRTVKADCVKEPDWKLAYDRQ